jgi:demethylmenaquinone methyltransferase / 2-methoxy-6-polyprenyl-1,4-benzoquinol methylase
MTSYAQCGKEQFVHKIFTAIACRYDLMNTLLTFNLDRYWRRTAVEMTGLKRGGNALDVCCGTGKLTIGLGAIVGSSGQVVGLDFCHNMLHQANKNIAGTPQQAIINLVEGNAMALPFADAEFDCSTIGFALRNVPCIKTVLSEMRRVVKPGGRVVSLELAKPGMPGFKELYFTYLEKGLPLIGKLIGHGQSYRWLPESLRLYPHQSDVAELFREVGFRDVKYYELTGGIAAVHVGVV